MWWQTWCKNLVFSYVTFSNNPITSSNLSSGMTTGCVKLYTLPFAFALRWEVLVVVPDVKTAPWADVPLQRASSLSLSSHSLSCLWECDRKLENFVMGKSKFTVGKCWLTLMHDALSFTRVKHVQRSCWLMGFSTIKPPTANLSVISPFPFHGFLLFYL